MINFGDPLPISWDETATEFGYVLSDLCPARQVTRLIQAITIAEENEYWQPDFDFESLVLELLFEAIGRRLSEGQWPR
jgi:hypothetical protein